MYPVVEAVMASTYPLPPNPEQLYGKILLLCGEVPDKGWRVARYPDGDIFSIYGAGKDAGKYESRVIKVCYDQVKLEVAKPGWSTFHTDKVGRMWKNMFLRWLWEEKEND